MKVQRILFQETNEVTFELLDDAGQPIEIVSRFMRHLHARDYSPNTLSAYCFDLLHFMTFLRLQHLTYEQFTPSHAWTLLEYLRELPSRTQAQRFGPVLCTTNQGRSTTRLSPATINRILATVSSFYEYLIVTEVFPGRENPIQKVDDPALARISERHRPFMGCVRTENTGSNTTCWALLAYIQKEVRPPAPCLSKHPIVDETDDVGLTKKRVATWWCESERTGALPQRRGRSAKPR